MKLLRCVPVPSPSRRRRFARDGQRVIPVWDTGRYVSDRPRKFAIDLHTYAGSVHGCVRGIHPSKPPFTSGPLEPLWSYHARLLNLGPIDFGKVEIEPRDCFARGFIVGTDANGDYRVLEGLCHTREQHRAGFGPTGSLVNDLEISVVGQFLRQLRCARSKARAFHVGGALLAFRTARQLSPYQSIPKFWPHR